MMPNCDVRGDLSVLVRRQEALAGPPGNYADRALDLEAPKSMSASVTARQIWTLIA